MASIPSQLKSLIARRLLAAGVAAFAAILALGTFLVFLPEWERIQQADRAARLQEERQAKEAYLKKLDELDRNFRSFPAQDAGRIKAMLPSEEDIPGLLATIEAVGRASDIAVTSINFSKGDAHIPGLQAVTIALSLQHGDYAHFKLFLQELESSLRLFDVRGASLSPQGASYTLTLQTYLAPRTNP